MKRIIILVALFFAFLCWLFLSSCKMTETAAMKKLAKIESKQPAVPAKYCADRFPPVVYDSTRTVYKPGTTVTNTDTVTVKDTINNTVYKYITKAVYNRDTITTVSIKQVENKAKIEALTVESGALKEKLASQKKALSIAKWVCIFLGGYTLARWILRIWNIKLP